MTTRICLVLLSVLAIAACSSSTAPALQSGEDAEVTFDGLIRVDNTIMDSVWAQPGIDLRGVSKVIFVPVGISYRDVEPSDPSTA